MAVPDELFTSIPDDADENTKLYMRAQVIIQAAFYALGDREISSGEATLATGELEEILSAALGMLVAADGNLATKRDIRERLEHHAKYARGFANILRDAQDARILQLLDVLRMRQSSAN